MTATDTLTLPQWLLEQIAAVEADVRARGTFAVGHSAACIFEGGYEGTSDCDCGAVARVLRQCAALRAVVALHVVRDVSPSCSECGGYTAKNTPRGIEHSGYAIPWPCPTLRALATIYADRPGWQEAWA